MNTETAATGQKIASEPAHRPRSRWCILALGAIVILMAMRPGDSTFVSDEPRLLKLAQYWDHHPSAQYGVHLPFAVSPVSLLGPHGLYYGPASMWAYQIMVAFTTNPIILTSIHAILLGSVTAICLYWLGQTMRVNPALAVITMLSPWLWFFCRQLWDNSFCIPLAAVVITAYADFLSTHRPWSLRLSVAAAAIMPLVHFMSLALIVPVAIHLIFFQTRWAMKYWWSLLAIVLAINAVGWPYWVYVYSFHDSVQIQTFMEDSSWKGWFLPLLGGQNLSASGVEQVLGNDWLYLLPSPGAYVVVAAETLSLAAHLAVWAGMILSVPMAWRVLRRKSGTTPMDHLAAVALGTVICQTLIDGIQHIYGQPHYFNATWIVYVVFAWTAVDAMVKQFAARSVLVRVALPIYAACLLTILVLAEYKIARDGGTRSLHYGTTLSQQFAAAEAMNQYSPDSPIIYAFDQWRWFSETPECLRRWAPIASEQKGRRVIIVRYRDDYPGDARIVVEDRPIR